MLKMHCAFDMIDFTAPPASGTFIYLGHIGLALSALEEHDDPHRGVLGKSACCYAADLYWMSCHAT